MRSKTAKRFLESAKYSPEAGLHPELKKINALRSNVVASADGFRMHVIQNAPLPDENGEMKDKFVNVLKMTTNISPVCTFSVDARFLQDVISCMAGDESSPIEISFYTNGIIEIAGTLNDKNDTDAYALIMMMKAYGFHHWKPLQGDWISPLEG